MCRISPIQVVSRVLWVGIAAGLAFVARPCAAETNVVAWGLNNYGQSTVPAGLQAVRAADAGPQTAMAVRLNGTIAAWGSNQYGLLSVPPGLSDAVQVAVGLDHAMAVRAGGAVVCWGSNSYGQLNVPAGLPPIKSVAAETYFSVALSRSGTVHAWGSNQWGQLNIPGSAAVAIEVSAGGNYIAALRPDHVIAAWGFCGYGQCFPPADIGPVAAISAGNLHMMALTSAGTVRCWGWNRHGQSAVPAGLDRVVAIAAGMHHSVALRETGEVVCWGAGCAPSQPTGPVVRISAGWDFSVALLASDSDGDGVDDSLDNCPTQVNPDQADSDGDGVGDACVCTTATVDSDLDGTLDCVDGCPNDPAKILPGTCGCGVSDADADGDGVADCIDGCPNDPAKTLPGACGCGVSDADGDGDGVADCNDGCPADSGKSAPGICGCGVPDADLNGNGAVDCIENCDDSFDFVSGTPQPGARFGAATALDGDWLAIGAPDEDHGGITDAGAAYVFRRIGGQWAAVARLTAPSPAASDRFGAAIAWRVGGLVVGAPGAYGGEGQVFDFAPAGDGSFPAGVGLEPNGPATETFETSTDFISPFDTANHVSLKLFNLPPAAGDVTVSIDHFADMGAANETYTLSILGFTSPPLRSGTDCSPGTDQVVVPASVFNESALTGRWVFLLAPNANVGPCPNSAARIRLSYQTPRVEAASATIAPFDDSHPAIATFTTLRPNLGDAFIQVVRRGDINATNESYQIYLDGAPVGGAVLNPEIGGPECVTITDTRVVAASQLAAAMSDGAVTISAVSNGGIDPCQFSEAQIVLRYQSRHERGLGSSVACDGTTIFVGAPSSQSGAASEAGAVLKYVGGAQGPHAKALRISATTPVAGERLGSALSFSGGLLAAGGPASGATLGVVRVFATSGATVHVLAAPVGALGFGSALAMTPSAIVVGAPDESGFGLSSIGAVHSYTLGSGGAWIPSQRISCPAPANGRRFGTAVAIADGVLVAGAPGGGGAVYVASPNKGGVFGPPQLRDSCTAASDLSLGHSLSASARTFAAGLPEQVGGRTRLYALPPACAADLYLDGRVDGADLAIVLARWGPADATGAGDIDGDGIVGGSDLAVVLSNWGVCP